MADPQGQMEFMSLGEGGDPTLLNALAPPQAPQPDLAHLVFPADPPNYYRGSLIPLAGQTDSSGRVIPSTREWAIPGMVRDVVNDLAMTGAAPGLASQGRLQSSDLPAVANKMGLTLMGLGSGIGLSSGETEGALGIFGGRLAKTADLDALGLAKELDGISTPEHIFDQTGWFRGADNQWRFTIPDSNALVEYVPPLAAGVKLGQVLHHPELFAAYPDLANVYVGHARPGFTGEFDPGGVGLTLPTMRIDPSQSNHELTATALHEVQHAVQDKEGFAEGGTPSEFLPMSQRQIEAQKAMHLDTMNSQAQKLQQLGIDPGELFVAARTGKDLTPILGPHTDNPAVTHYLGALDSYAGLQRMQAGAEQDYQNLAGEVEARSVEAQLAAEDWSRLPQHMEGYPAGPQIFKYNGKLVQGSPVEHNPFTHSSAPVEGDPFAPQGAASFKGWHGTPHEFDQFSNDAIGSGEGAQAFGWGHYVAGNRKTGEMYQQASASEPTLVYNGKPIAWRDATDLLHSDLTAKGIPNNHTSDSYEALRSMLGSPSKYWTPENKDQILQHAQQLFSVQPGKPGSLLHIEVKPDEHELLDWDSPLSEQSHLFPSIEKSLPPERSLDLRSMLNNPETYNGHALYHHIIQQSGSVQKASEALHKAGIPGIKYLDQFSRGRPPEEQTRNYVIFHPSNLRIIGKNGQSLEPIDHDPFSEPSK